MQHPGGVTVEYSVRHHAPPDELEALGAWIQDLLQEFEEHPDAEVRERVFALLDGVDALHRATLTRLVTLLQGPGAGIVWRRVQQDPLVRTLLDLYDLLPGSEAGPGTGAGPVPTPPSIRLTVVSDNAASPLPVQADPEWDDAGMFDDLPSGTMRGMRVRGSAILLCNLDGELFGWEDACPDTPLALSTGQLDGEEIVCPWHGCRFHARTGERLVHRGTSLVPYPVEIASDVIRVASNLRGFASVGGRV